MFLEFIRNTTALWLDVPGFAIAFLIGIVINIILAINDYKYRNKKITGKVILFRFIVILYIPIIYFFLLIGCGFGVFFGESADRLNYSYSYSNKLQTEEIKRMDYDIYIQDNGNIHVKQIIEVLNNRGHFFIELPKNIKWLKLGGEILESRNFKIKDVTLRKNSG